MDYGTQLWYIMVRYGTLWYIGYSLSDDALHRSKQPLRFAGSCSGCFGGRATRTWRRLRGFGRQKVDHQYPRRSRIILISLRPVFFMFGGSQREVGLFQSYSTVGFSASLHLDEMPWAIRQVRKRIPSMPSHKTFVVIRRFEAKVQCLSTRILCWVCFNPSFAGLNLQNPHVYWHKWIQVGFNPYFDWFSQVGTEPPWTMHLDIFS